MPDTTSSETTAPSGASKRLIVIGVFCAVIAGAGFVLGGRMSAGPAASAEAVAEEEAEPTIDVIVELDPLSVNLAGGHYLRLAVAIALTDDHGGEAAAESGGHGSSAEEEPPIETAPASDLVLSTFSGRAMDELSSADGREAARHDLYEGLVDFYGETVVTVLFTEFVMQ